MTRSNLIAIALAVLVLAVGGPWLIGQLKSLPGRGNLDARADQKIVTLEVAGMTCDACAAQIEGTLTTLDGVKTAEVRWQQKRAYVVCDKAVADSSLLTAVRNSGNFHGQVVAR
jgi:mercuric ion binding protein